MSVATSADSAASVRPPAGIRWLGALLKPWIRIRQVPDDVHSVVPDSSATTVYVVERYGLSDILILGRACAEAGLPSPWAAADKLLIRRSRAVIAVIPRPRLFGRAPRHSYSETLARIVELMRSDGDREVRLIPVSIFVGRAPDRESNWFRVLFMENWGMVGRFRRLLAILLNGRGTIVQFSAPVPVRDVLDEDTERGIERNTRKLSRLLRVHFRRVRASVIGPDLSHRRTVIGALLNAAPVRAAITATATRENIDYTKAKRQARTIAMEISADYSHTFVRSASYLLSWFWNQLYDGIAMHHFETTRTAASGHEVVYVPCHRSHADYLLLSYQLHHSGVVPPHIAAGVNLNLPVLGPALRRGGAFFMRRSFKGNPLYSTVFKEYLAQLLDRGVPLEYFIEGGRSRTGRLLAPRSGMLSMTVRAFLRSPHRPVIFQPVYIGYEKLMEGKSYVGELSGKPKQRESWLSLLRGLGVLRQRYGHVALSFGEPVHLTPLLNAASETWRSEAHDPEVKPEWLNGMIDHLAERIQENVNRSADVNPINLLALALLSTPKHAMTQVDLVAQLALTKALLSGIPYSERITITALEPQAIIEYGEKMECIRRVAHPLGDVLVADGEPGVLLSYFRNNVLHLTATAAWIACCFLNNQRMARGSIVRLGRLVYPFIQSELFLPWTEEEFGERIQRTIDFFINRDLLQTQSDGRVVARGAGQSDAAFRLRAIAHSLLQAFERYYIAIALLVKNGPGVLSAAELENLCHLTAQRLSLLHELNAPEFFDRSLFRGFIRKLRERGVVWIDESGKLVFDTALESVARDARVILSREIRHSILKLTPEAQAEIERNIGSAQAGK